MQRADFDELFLAILPRLFIRVLAQVRKSEDAARQEGRALHAG